MNVLNIHGSLINRRFFFAKLYGNQESLPGYVSVLLVMSENILHVCLTVKMDYHKATIVRKRLVKLNL